MTSLNETLQVLLDTHFASREPGYNDEEDIQTVIYGNFLNFFR